MNEDVELASKMSNPPVSARVDVTVAQTQGMGTGTQSVVVTQPQTHQPTVELPTVAQGTAELAISMQRSLSGSRQGTGYQILTHPSGPASVKHVVTAPPGTSGGHKVLVAPKPHATSGHSKQINFNVRVVNPKRKREYETYVLHNVGGVSSPDELRKEILKQFGSTTVSNKVDFSLGYIKSGSKVWIRTSSDVVQCFSVSAVG